MLFHAAGMQPGCYGKQPGCSWDAAGMQLYAAGCRVDAARMQHGCSWDAAGMQPGCSRDAAGMQLGCSGMQLGCSWDAAGMQYFAAGMQPGCSGMQLGNIWEEIRTQITQCRSGLAQPVPLQQGLPGCFFCFERSPLLLVSPFRSGTISKNWVMFRFANNSANHRTCHV